MKSSILNSALEPATGSIDPGARRVTRTAGIVAIVAVALSLSVAHAGAHDRSPQALLAWDCDRAGAPGYPEVRDAFGVRDFHRAHRASLHLREVIKRACASGTDRLLLVKRSDGEGRARYVTHVVD